VILRRKTPVEIVREKLVNRGALETKVGQFVLPVTLPEGGELPLTAQLHTNNLGSVSLPVMPFSAPDPIAEAGFLNDLHDINRSMVGSERLFPWQNTVFNSMDTIRYDGESDRQFALRFLKSAVELRAEHPQVLSEVLRAAENRGIRRIK
jgi:hypothetical protein